MFFSCKPRGIIENIAATKAPVTNLQFCIQFANAFYASDDRLNCNLQDIFIYQIIYFKPQIEKKCCDILWNSFEEGNLNTDDRSEATETSNTETDNMLNDSTGGQFKVPGGLVAAVSKS